MTIQTEGLEETNQSVPVLRSNDDLESVTH